MDHLYDLVQEIATAVGKNPHELTDVEFMLHFKSPTPTKDPFQGQGIVEIFDEYAKRREKNQYYQFLATQKRVKTECLDDTTFVERFGPPPWELFDALLHKVFQGKYSLKVESGNIEYAGFSAKLVAENDLMLDISQLSTGEQVLLTIAVSLFRAQLPSASQHLGGKLLLLDEPDAYLHPKMVTQMYSAFEMITQSCGAKIIFSTHSPTTAALAPRDSIILLQGDRLTKISNDAAVGALLDGVTQIAIDPENRRQVFVESHFDAATYQILYACLKRKENLLDEKISIEFVPSGPKMPPLYVEQALTTVFGEQAKAQAGKFLTILNGSGNCDQVYSTVNSLAELGNRSIRGLVDWDAKNKSAASVVVMGEGVYYTKENIFIDPLATAIFVATKCGSCSGLSAQEISGCDGGINKWLTIDGVPQTAADWFIKRLLGADNARDHRVKYIGGLEVLSDKRVVSMNGHVLSETFVEKTEALRKFVRGPGRKDLAHLVAEEVMIDLTGGDLIPVVFVQALQELQKPAEAIGHTAQTAGQP